jgi:malate synthase
MTASGLEIHAPHDAGFADILSTDARRFLTELARAFEPRRRQLLTARAERQQRLDAGEMPDFLPHTRAVREAAWTVAPIPADLMDRRVEITGPVDRKMVINALNSGARVYMADFEDSNTPTWRNNLEGQINLRDAVRGTISFSVEGSATPSPRTATLMVGRAAGISRKARQWTGAPCPALFDFGLFFFTTPRR